MPPWPIDDPSPDEDLPSDIAFGAWLESLDARTVLAHHERMLKRLTGEEKARMDYFKRRLLRSEHRSPIKPPPASAGGLSREDASP